MRVPDELRETLELANILKGTLERLPESCVRGRQALAIAYAEVIQQGMARITPDAFRGSQGPPAAQQEASTTGQPPQRHTDLTQWARTQDGQWWTLRVTNDGSSIVGFMPGKVQYPERSGAWQWDAARVQWIMQNLVPMGAASDGVIAEDEEDDVLTE